MIKNNQSANVTNSLDLYRETTQFLFSGQHQHATWLHGKGKPKKDDLTDRVNSLKRFVRIENIAGQRVVPRSLPLTILIVENDIESYKKYTHFAANTLWGHLSKESNWYIVRDNLAQWEQELRSCKNKDNPHIRVNKLVWTDDSSGSTNIKDKKTEIDCSNIDLILQDIFLDQDTEIPLGYQLTEHYFDLMPQAIVFLLTAMDVEYLAATGITHKADRVISKMRMGAIWWYYYQAFTSLYGRIFWKPWCKAGDDGTISSRKYMRKLFGCLRRWIMEPEILWHGQNLPEMIDHGHQHITDLWRMTDTILGIAVENSPSFHHKLTHEERVLLALGIWLHDVGHRGDQFSIEPMAIRDAHGAISERLLLSEPEALGLGWLKDLCKPYAKECGCEEINLKTRSEIRNKLPSINKNGKLELCTLRKVGLLCRAHQSSAPIWAEKLSDMWKKLKFSGHYSRIGYDEKGVIKKSDKSLSEWCDSTVDMNWIGSDIRCVEDFKDEKLVTLTCLLRWLDALHVSRVRTGSQIHQTTHRLFLEERRKWCKGRLKELRDILEQSSAGSKTYQNTTSEQIRLLSYAHLLDVQDIHLWRHNAVDRIMVKWKIVSGTPILTISFEVFPKELSLDIQDSLKQQWDEINSNWNVSDWSVLPSNFKYWAAHVFDDVISSEFNSQKRDGDTKSVVESLFDPIHICIDFVAHDNIYLLWPLNKNENGLQ